MVRLFLVLALGFIVHGVAPAQVHPSEGSTLNYRIIGFSFPSQAGSDKYKIEIASGNFRHPDSFARHIVVTSVTADTKKILEVPAFGQSYTWRVTALAHKPVPGPLRHFATGTTDRIDTTRFRLRIIQPAEVDKDAYVTSETSGVIYDMKGNPVWYIPDSNGLGGVTGDMKVTDRNSITFLYGKVNYEINYDSKIIWATPNKGLVSNDTIMGEVYHHEFTRLSNGHYMMLGTEFMLCKEVPMGDSNAIISFRDKDKTPRNGYSLGRFGNIIEYDADGHLVWSWHSYKYLVGTDFNYFRYLDTILRFDPHDNALTFDEQNHCVYLGFRNLSWIMKIGYPDGKVEAIYGHRFRPGMHEIGASLFCNQHNIGRAMDGDLYVFNNNSCRNRDSLPTIVVFSEPKSPSGDIKVDWEYTCTMEHGYPSLFGSGGNAQELPDRSFYVCMGSQYSKLFIVGRDKKERWSALPERYMNTDGKWTPNHEYRSVLISRRQLEDMIWASPNLKPQK